MRAPEFWRIDGAFARLAAPLGIAYGVAGRIRFACSDPWRTKVPVICVGNLVMGGAGKTPVAAALGAEFGRLGTDVHFLTRGYGGRNAGPIRVEPRIHVATEVGDESLLLSEIAPTWVSRDRTKGAKAAEAAGAEVIVMDDGYQNPSLAKDLAFLVVDGEYGIGNGRVFPAGPMREPWSFGLARANAAILIGEDSVAIELELRAHLHVFRARFVPAPGAERLAGRDVVAFAGIGRPQKFFVTLREMGCQLCVTRSFPDHHHYSDFEIVKLLDLAEQHGAIPVTTAKDAARLSPEMRALVEVLDVELDWEEDDALAKLVAPVLDRSLVQSVS